MPGWDASAQQRLASALKVEARRLGFDACGLARAEKLDDEARKLEAWLKASHHAEMGWMERNFDKRTDPRLLVDGAKTIVSVLCNYYQPLEHPSEAHEIGLVSRYAWGDDYHDVLKEKLAALMFWLQDATGGCGGRAFVDSAPVMDKAWAARAGLGWQGKHSNLISRSLGSWFFIGELIVDVELPPDGPVPNYCGSCTRCIDACPTDAIVEDYVVDANRCISYLTIEHRGEFPPDAPLSGMGNWIFGCDICQDVCPWNKFKRPTAEPRFLPRPGMTDTALETWKELDLEAFRLMFRKNPVKRATWEGFMRNVSQALTGLPERRP